MSERSKKLPPDAPVPVGAQLMGVLDIAYRARRPVLLEGPTGIGKSQIVAQFAASAGIDVMVLDLSLLEPPDLVGLPMIRDDRTHYATPAELPTSGCGVLMLEELNRAEIPVMQPALQLLSARRLHAYELPPGWSAVAAVNPEDGDYHVNRLDAAMRSRFLQVTVSASRAEWLRWAVRTNVHPLVCKLVSDHADVFDAAPPRSWAYVGELLSTVRPEEQANRDLVRTALRGYLPTPWAVLVAEALSSYPVTPAVEVEALLAGGGRALAQALASFGNRSDAVVMLASSLRRALVGERVAGAVARGELTMASLEQLCAPLPGDLREQCLESLADSPAADALLAQLGVESARLVAHGLVSSGARALVVKWREQILVHRIRLVCARVLHTLRAGGPGLLEALARDPGRQREIEALIVDAGPLAEDLSRWLRAHALGAAMGAS